MLITENFIVLQFPKTGTTFLREVVKKIYASRYPFYLKPIYKLGLAKPPLREVFFQNIQSPNPRSRFHDSQHGAYCQVPAEDKGKPVITIARNPYELFISTYTSKWWMYFDPVEKEKLHSVFPSFPKVSLDEYVQLTRMSTETDPALKLGSLSIQFMRMYFKDPDAVLKTITPGYISSPDAYKKDMGDNIRFLLQDDLNNVLADFLETQGFSKKETAFIRTYKKINPGEISEEDKKTSWTKEAIEHVQVYERFLLNAYKNAGFIFEEPLPGQPILKQHGNS